MLRKILLLSSILHLFFTISFAQHTHQCSHRVGFDKSLISDTLDAINYRIYLTVTDFTNHTILGKTEIDLQAKIDGVDEIKLELQQLTVDSLFVEGEEIFNFDHTANLITIPLNEAINTGEQITVRIHYSGEPFHEAWGGFHWSGEKAFNLGVGFESIPHNLGKTWFPCIDDFHDRAYYDVYATVEDTKKAVCGGLLIEVINNGNGTDTYHWSLSHSIPTYLASIAVGNYNVYTDTYNGINADIPIEIYGGSISMIEGSFQHLKEILAIFENKYGPYPWERIGYVATAIGAMEHATNVAYPGFAINGNLSYESLYAHELSHMWFGDNVTCSSAEEMWLNEGWAVYSEALYKEFLYGYDEYIDGLMDNHLYALHYCHTPPPQGDGGYFPLNDIPQNVTYGKNAYERGSTVVHTLRSYLGDEIFFDAIKAYNQEYQYNYASSYDLEEFLTSYTGIEMHDFFENWVYTPGTPHYAIDWYQIEADGDGNQVTVRVEQKHKAYDYIGNSNIVEVTVLSELREEYSDTIHFDGNTGTKSFWVPFDPVMILCDYHDKLFDAVTHANVEIDQAGYINSPGTFVLFEVNSVEEPGFLRVEHNWAPPDPMQNPIQGLTLSDYRYWNIYGQLPSSLSASCMFNYSVSGYLDEGLITNPDDSLVLLYREYPWEEWEFIDFTQSGSWSSGHLIIDDINPGEYTLAICDDTFTNINENKLSTKKASLNIFPNPSNGKFIMIASQKGFVKIQDINGVVHDTIEIKTINKKQSVNLSHLNSGTYFARLLSEDYKTQTVKQIIIN